MFSRVFLSSPFRHYDDKISTFLQKVLSTKSGLKNAEINHLLIVNLNAICDFGLNRSHGQYGIGW